MAAPFGRQRQQDCGARWLIGQDRLRGVAHDEAFVAVGGDVVAALSVGTDTAGVGHEDPRLARNVGAQVPRVGEHVHRLVGDVADVLNPIDLGLRVGVDHVDGVLTQVLDEVRDPLDVLLDRDRHVAQHRRALRAGDHEHVGEVCGGETEVGRRAVTPLLPQLATLAAGDVDIEEGAGHGVVAGGEDDSVDLVLLAIRCAQSG